MLKKCMGLEEISWVKSGPTPRPKVSHCWWVGQDGGPIGLYDWRMGETGAELDAELEDRFIPATPQLSYGLA